jgi:hypothetical protein
VARPVEPLLREMITNMAGARAGRPGSEACLAVSTN